MRRRPLVSLVVAGLLASACGSAGIGAQPTPTIPPTSAAVKLAMADLRDWYVTPNWNAAVWGAMYQHRAANPCWRKKWPSKQAYLKAWSTQPPGINPEVGGPLTLVATTTVRPGEVEVRVKQPTATGYVAGWLDQVMAFDGRWAILHWTPAEIDKAGLISRTGRPGYAYGFEACQDIGSPTTPETTSPGRGG